MQDHIKTRLDPVINQLENVLKNKGYDAVINEHPQLLVDIIHNLDKIKGDCRMEEQNKVIKAFLDARGIDEQGVSKRQMNDLKLIFDVVRIMKEVLVSNEINVKNVAERTKSKDNNGRSISLATFYNNDKLLYNFVDYLKPENNVGARELLSKAEAEIDALRSELKRLRGQHELARTTNSSVPQCIRTSDKTKS